jgi:hypothetical protein
MGHYPTLNDGAGGDHSKATLRVQSAAGGAAWGGAGMTTGDDEEVGGGEGTESGAIVGSGDGASMRSASTPAKWGVGPGAGGDDYSLGAMLEAAMVVGGGATGGGEGGGKRKGKGKGKGRRGVSLFGNASARGQKRS